MLILARPTKITLAEMREQGARFERAPRCVSGTAQSRLHNLEKARAGQSTLMSRPIIFTCPITNERVQHWLEDRDDAPEDKHEGIDCPACSRFHFIHRRSGKVLGYEDP
jgi:hypothetical protein